MWSLGGEPRGGDRDVEPKGDSEGACSWSWLRKWAREEAQGGKGHTYLLSSSYIPPTQEGEQERVLASLPVTACHKGSL